MIYPGDFHKYAAKNVVVPRNVLKRMQRVFPTDMFGGPELRTFRPGKMPRSQLEERLSRIGLSGTDVGYMPMKTAPRVRTPGGEAAREAYKVPVREQRLQHSRDLQHYVTRAREPYASELRGQRDQARRVREQVGEGPWYSENFDDYLSELPAIPPPGVDEQARAYLQGVQARPEFRVFRDRVTVPQWISSQATGEAADKLTAQKLRTMLNATRGEQRIVPGSTKNLGAMDRLRHLFGGTTPGRGVEDLHPGVRRQLMELSYDPAVRGTMHELGNSNDLESLFQWLDALRARDLLRG